MAKGRPAKKEPDAWETACQITNTVLEVAKVHHPWPYDAVHLPLLLSDRLCAAGLMMVVDVQPIVHLTFIPLIIVLGMTMTGEPTAFSICLVSWPTYVRAVSE